MEQTHMFTVKMTCGGCSGAVNRALTKMEGVSTVDISMEKQTVAVTGTASYDAVFEAIKKTGKSVTPFAA